MFNKQAAVALIGLLIGIIATYAVFEYKNITSIQQIDTSIAQQEVGSQVAQKQDIQNKQGPQSVQVIMSRIEITPGTSENKEETIESIKIVEGPFVEKFDDKGVYLGVDEISKNKTGEVFVINPNTPASWYGLMHFDGKENQTVGFRKVELSTQQVIDIFSEEYQNQTQQIESMKTLESSPHWYALNYPKSGQDNFWNLYVTSDNQVIMVEQVYMP